MHYSSIIVGKGVRTYCSGGACEKVNSMFAHNVFDVVETSSLRRGPAVDIIVALLLRSLRHFGGPLSAVHHTSSGDGGRGRVPQETRRGRRGHLPVRQVHR